MPVGMQLRIFVLPSSRSILSDELISLLRRLDGLCFRFNLLDIFENIQHNGIFKFFECYREIDKIHERSNVLNRSSQLL